MAAKARLFVTLLFVAVVSHSETLFGPIGPPAKLSVVAEKHLFDVIVSPPRASKGYTPGAIKVFLMREYPDYMLVELGQERIKDGRIRVHFAISPEQISKYLIRVSDLQKNGDWMLLNETPLEEIERVGGRVSSLPNTSLERTRER